jgi:hypothetical protein
MVPSILSFALTGSGDTSIDVSEGNFIISSYQQASDQGGGAVPTFSFIQTKTSLVLNNPPQTGSPSYSVKELSAGSFPTDIGSSWGGGSPTIGTLYSDRLGTENEWTRTGTVTRTEEYVTQDNRTPPPMATITWDESDYIRWEQSKILYEDSELKPYYVKDTVLEGYQAFNQGGTGIAKFTDNAKVSSKNTEVINTRNGSIVIEYSLLGGGTGSASFAAKVEVRECESFTKNRYTRIQEGIYQDVP